MSGARPSRVLLLRHAETASPNVFHGAESDVGLSERGLRECRLTPPSSESIFFCCLIWTLIGPNRAPGNPRRLRSLG
jgi:hypothetical protein